MNFTQRIEAIDSHTMGEPTRVLIEPPIGLKGTTVAEKRDFMRQQLDHIRTAVVNEPRGHAGMFAALLTAPGHPQADLGLIYMDSYGYVNMCVHATIAAAVVVLETGIIPVTSAEQKLTIETPAGLVNVRAHVANATVESVVLTNVPSFAFLSDAAVTVRGKRLKLDVSYGGNLFAIVSADQLGVQVSQSNIDALVGWGMDIREAANQQLQVRHPENPSIDQIHMVLIHGEPLAAEAQSKNIIVSGYGKVDRSPCGTGTCARMAALYAKGALKVGDTFVNEGIIGTCFTGKVEREVQIGEYSGIVPQIRGSAYITGFHTFLIDERDPLKHGFRLKK